MQVVPVLPVLPADCEGIKYARAINEHLPEDVCVFSVQVSRLACQKQTVAACLIPWHAPWQCFKQYIDHCLAGRTIVNSYDRVNALLSGIVSCDVRVCLQRTNKGFDARRWCGSRTYEYYLPASVLGLDTPDGSSSEDQARLALLREVLQAYCGYKPFQNYAGQRSQYVGQKEKGEQDCCCVLARVTRLLLARLNFMCGTRLCLAQHAKLSTLSRLQAY